MLFAKGMLWVMDKTIKRDISIIIPFFNEEGNVEELVSSITKSFADINYELILVDDGSTDSTLSKLNKIKSEQIRVLPLAVNYGQSIAIKAGFDFCTGTTIGILDGDLQNSAKSLLEMYRVLNFNRLDMVHGFRKKRNDPFHKRMPSKAANFLIGLLFSIQLKDIGCSAKVFRREVLDEMIYFKGFHRYISLMSICKGFNVSEMVVDHYPRVSGNSKYGISRVLSVSYHVFMLKFYAPMLNTKLEYVLK